MTVLVQNSTANVRIAEEPITIESLQVVRETAYLDFVREILTRFSIEAPIVGNTSHPSWNSNTYIYRDTAPISEGEYDLVVGPWAAYIKEHYAPGIPTLRQAIEDNRIGGNTFYYVYGQGGCCLLGWLAIGLYKTIPYSVRPYSDPGTYARMVLHRAIPNTDRVEHAIMSMKNVGLEEPLLAYIYHALGEYSNE